MNTLIKNNKHIKKNSSEFIENSHLTKPTSNSGNINMFDNILQYDERSSHDQNNILSGQYLYLYVYLFKKNKTYFFYFLENYLY